MNYVELGTSSISIPLMLLGLHLFLWKHFQDHGFVVTRTETSIHKLQFNFSMGAYKRYLKRRHETHNEK